MILFNLIIEGQLDTVLAKSAKVGNILPLIEWYKKNSKTFSDFSELFLEDLKHTDSLEKKRKNRLFMMKQDVVS